MKPISRFTAASSFSDGYSYTPSQALVLPKAFATVYHYHEAPVTHLPYDASRGLTHNQHEHAALVMPEHHSKHRLISLLSAGLLFLSGLMLGKAFPKQVESTFKLISPDWKDWAKIILGISAVNQLNTAFQWKPAPWLAALESAIVINPLIAGFSKLSFVHMVVVAPVVSVVVQLTSWLNETLAEPIERHLKIPALVTRLLTSIAMMAAGVKVYPSLFIAAGKSGLLGDVGRQEALALLEAQQGQKSTLGGMVGGCSCCGSIICMREIAEFLGGTITWMKSHTPGHASHSETDSNLMTRGRSAYVPYH